MKMTPKRENDEFFVMPLKQVLGLMGHANRPRTPDLWAIAHENGHKTHERRIVRHPFKHASGLMVHEIPVEHQNSVE